MEKFLTVKEAAAALKVENQTIKRWIREGKIDAVKIGRFYRISESAIEKAVKASTTKKGGK
jgi:acetyl-CoA synthetase